MVNDNYEHFDDIEEVVEILQKTEDLVENKEYEKAKEILEKVLKYKKKVTTKVWDELDWNPEDTDLCELLLDYEELIMKLINKLCNFYPIIEGEYLYFGTYPQTLKEKYVSIVSTNPDKDGYYLGNDGERYAKADVINRGSFPKVFNDKKTEFNIGETYYFKVEAIKWKIESKSKGVYKLISDVILDCQMYYSSIDERIIDEQTIYANNYENSDIRKWLNHDFLNKAFSPTQQLHIDTSKVDNSSSSTGSLKNLYVCNNTSDKIYLPSYSEITNASCGYSSRSSRQKQITDYAKVKGCSMETSSNYYNNGEFWLRSPYYENSIFANSVNNIGDVIYCDVSKSFIGVVPALTIKLKLKCENHLKSDWIIKKDPTCIENGSKYKKCTLCGKTLETKKIEAFGHNYINGKCSVCGSIKDVLEFKNGYIYFGEYPQTLKEDKVTVSSTTDSDGYYMGSDGERYAKVEAYPRSSSYVFNDNTTSIVKGNTYYFKVEPIKWKIESKSNGVYKLISDLIIDNQKFYSSRAIRKIDGKTTYANNYEYSDIRTWLNNTFLNQAFSTIQQSYINTTEVDNSALSTEYSINKYACNNTFDKVYLPSYREMNNSSYGYINKKYSHDLARQKQVTDFAKAKGCSMETSSNYYNNGEYWLRSPLSDSRIFACSVNYTGYITCSEVNGYNENECSFIGTYVGVAPTLTITIK